MCCYPSFEMSFFRKSDVICSLGHYPCSVLGLVFRNQENVFWHCCFQSTRVWWSWVIFLLDVKNRTRNYTIRRGVRAGRRTKERQLNSTRAISVNIQTRRMKQNNPRVCIPENCVRILPSRVVPKYKLHTTFYFTYKCLSVRQRDRGTPMHFRYKQHTSRHYSRILAI